MPVHVELEHPIINKPVSFGWFYPSDSPFRLISPVQSPFNLFFIRTIFIRPSPQDRFGEVYRINQKYDVGEDYFDWVIRNWHRRHRWVKHPDTNLRMIHAEKELVFEGQTYNQKVMTGVGMVTLRLKFKINPQADLTPCPNLIK